MLQWMKIAARNIAKNKRRSMVTLMAIAMGFAAINTFNGYTHNTYEGLRESAIRGAGIGHVTLYKEGWHRYGKTDPEGYMFPKEQIDKIIALVEEEDEVLLATPRLNISGLVSNGRNATIFLAEGVIPRDEKTVKGAFFAAQAVTGETLADKHPYGIEMAHGLAEHLELGPSSNGVVMAATLDGQMNALDIEVAGIYDTGVDATNDKFMKVPFTFAQDLYDTEKADRIVVLLDHWQNTERARDKLMSKLAAAGILCEAKTWKELSVFYRNVKDMFDMIFLFIFTIVLIIVVMSTVNTMGMAVIERTREIGTLRALGLKRRGVSLLFAIEGGLIGTLGAVIGATIYGVAWLMIRVIEPSYTPPGSSSPVPLMVDFLPLDMVLMGVVMLALSLGAAIVPARRAARQNVVAALGHV